MRQVNHLMNLCTCSGQSKGKLSRRAKAITFGGVEKMSIHELPSGYSQTTKCCRRCRHALDRSSPDSIELYCNVKSDAPAVELHDISSPEFDAHSMKQMEWEVRHGIEPWATCVLWEERENECPHGKLSDEYCTFCSDEDGR